jgi:ABC-type glycerol-3-phosphate transport system substrate-binding protein
LTLLADAFTSLHPNVEFSITYVPADEIIPSLIQPAAQGVSPTVFFASSGHGPHLLDTGIIRDLRLDLPPDLPAQIYPLAWSQVRFGEAVLGVPIRQHGNVLYRNRSLAPRPAGTLADLRETADELRSVGLTGAYFDFATEFSAPFADTCDADFAPLEGSSDFAESAGLCWLELLQFMSASGPVTMDSDEDLLLFESSESGWYLGSTEELESLNQILGENVVSIDPWPHYARTGRRLSGFVWTENAYIHAGVDEIDLAANLEFLLFLISPEAQLTLAGIHGGRFNSVRPSVRPEDPQLEQIKATLELGVPLPIWAGPDPYHEALERAIRAVGIQGTDPNTAYERALLDLEAEPEEDAGG